MKITLGNVLVLAQVTPGLSKKVKMAIKDLPGEALSQDLTGLHDYLRSKDYPELLSSLDNLGVSVDDVIGIQSSKEFKLFLEQSEEAQLGAIKNLHHDYCRKEVFKAAEELKENPPESNDDLLMEFSRKMAQVPSYTELSNPVSILNQMLKQMKDCIDNGKPLTLGTQFPTFDRSLGGFMPNSVTIIGADTGGGKSAFALNLLREWSKRGKNLLYFSLEMTDANILERLILQESFIEKVALDSFDFRNPKKESYTKILQLGSKLQDLKFEISNEDHLSGIERDIRKSDAEIVIIDHLHIIQNTSDHKEISVVTKALKKIALQENKILIVLIQYNRNSSARQNKAPVLTDFRGSGSIAFDADYCFAIHQPETEDENLCEMHCLKNRHGRTFVQPFEFIKEKQTFLEVANG